MTAKLTTGNVEHNTEVDVGFKCNTRVVEVDTGMKNIEKNIDINIAWVKIYRYKILLEARYLD
jgi:hypothetical protein